MNAFMSKWGDSFSLLLAGDSKTAIDQVKDEPVALAQLASCCHIAGYHTESRAILAAFRDRYCPTTPFPSELGAAIERYRNTIILASLYAILRLPEEASLVLNDAIQWREKNNPLRYSLPEGSEGEDEVRAQIAVCFAACDRYEEAVTLARGLRGISAQEAKARVLVELARKDSQQAERLVDELQLRDEPSRMHRTLCLLGIAALNRADAKHLYNMARNGWPANWGGDAPTRYLDEVAGAQIRVAEALYRCGLVSEGTEIERQAASRIERREALPPLPGEQQAWERSHGANSVLRPPGNKTPTGQVTVFALDPDRATALVKAGDWATLKSCWNEESHPARRSRLASAVAIAIQESKSRR